MKANQAQLERALKDPRQSRFFLFYGPDEAASRALARRVEAALGPDVERIELSGSELKGDPARLADEAASISLFGGARAVIVEPAADESLAAVEALLELPVAGNPVALVAGALKPASKLLKRALADPAAIAFASYVPEGQQADRLVTELARQQGLIVSPDVARRIADAGAGNRAVIAGELEKLALYAGASPERPRELTHEAVDAIGAASEGGDFSRLVDSVSGGDAPMLETELLRLKSEGIEGIALVRVVLRRMMLLARLRAEVERGNSVATVMASHGKSLFWKEKDAIGRQIGRWPSETIAKAIGRLVEAERQVKASGGLGPVAVDEELFAICRQAARLR